MANYILTKKAVKDLSDIWNYTFDKWSEQQADKYYHEILNEIKDLSKNPENGNSYFYLLNELKGVKVNKHIVFYRDIGKKIIEVERILHERMDLKTRLKE